MIIIHIISLGYFIIHFCEHLQSDSSLVKDRVMTTNSESGLHFFGAPRDRYVNHCLWYVLISRAMSIVI